MNSPTSPTHDVFRNVRNAYRLLHDYQQMIIDAVRYIAEQIDIPYHGGYPNFTRQEVRWGRAKLSQSAWDWLPMVGYKFQFVRFHENGTLCLFLLVISDTGYFEGDDSENDKEKTFSFASTDQSSSSTKFAFIISRAGWDDLTFMNDKKAMREFTKTAGSLPGNSDAMGLFGRCYDMSCLSSEGETDKIVQDIVELAKANKCPIELVPR